MSKTRKQWAAEINASAQKTIESYLETGRLLIAAKEGPQALPHGEFLAMIESDLPFGASKAERLMRIAADKRISARGPKLPEAWRTVYELSKLDDQTFESAIRSGAINPTMTRKGAQQLVREPTERQRAAALKLRTAIAQMMVPVPINRPASEGAAREPQPIVVPVIREQPRIIPDIATLPPAELEKIERSAGAAPIANPAIDQQAWQRSAAFHAGEAIALAGGWTKRFTEKWKTFPVDDALVAKVREAADAWDMILRAVSEQLDRQKTPAQ